MPCGAFTPLPSLPLKGGGDYPHMMTIPPPPLRGRVGVGGPQAHHSPASRARRSGKSDNRPSREAAQRPRSVMRPVTSRAGVTSKA